MSYLQQKMGNHEVRSDADQIVGGGDERPGGNGGVDAETVENERRNGTHEGSEQHDSEQR